MERRRGGKSDVCGLGICSAVVQAQKLPSQEPLFKQYLKQSLTTFKLFDNNSKHVEIAVDVLIMAKRQRVDEDEDDSHNENSGEEKNTSKFVQLNQSQQQTTIIQCSLTPHQSPISFSSYEDYDVHYAKVHTNRCSDCHKNFPSEHFLKLHIAENHDPINEARQARGDKIVCILEFVICFSTTSPDLCVVCLFCGRL